MKKIKCLFILLIFSILLVYFYENHIYYLIPYNPLDELDSDTLVTCYVRVNGDSKIKSHNPNNNALIFKYLRNLNLRPLNLNKKENRDKFLKHNYNTYYSYKLEFGPPTYYVHIDDIWLDNPTFVYIGSSKLGFRNGYYKIIDSKLDYMYVNELINDSKK
ncbi:hypothetical protein [Maledivibacter halophilus]|uniref:Uncharacterized protein n=1 Tax=Maledivibacter halophilus TaxID=36842 RepID=A0A1T5MB48_9FIRM|nr:hypothetical protein [Maledivibacter halophilus]SKC85440.1 hypothetical protein SAMN02194393_04355 [Maledivibacter halophilus]